MRWRYATKKFDSNKKLTEEQFSDLLETMILAPSSLGLQPWRLIVVKNSDLRTKLQLAGYDQGVITEASHFVVFTVEKNIDNALIDAYIKSVSETRKVPVEKLKEYEEMMKGFISGLNTGQKIEWAAKQAYIALGVLITSAAIEGIDVCPMEGFDPKKFDEILGLDKLGLESKIAAAIGFRATDDEYSKYKKVRYPKEKIVLEIK